MSEEMYGEILKSPLLKGQANPTSWLNLVKKRTGISFTPQVLCGSCQRQLTNQEIFSGFDPTGEAGVICPKCKKKASGQLIVVEGTKQRKINLSGTKSTVRQLKLLSDKPTSQPPAARIMAIFYTAKKF